MKEASEKRIFAVEADLTRLGIPRDGLDLGWIAKVREETEAVIDEVRKDPRFAGALPATAAWPELQWRERGT